MEAELAAVQRHGPDAETKLSQLKLAIAQGVIKAPSDCKVVLEAACGLAVARRDKQALERNLVQLRPFGLSEELFALNLLLLLVESRLPEFFALLEVMDKSTSSKHIDFVVGLERNLTEGSYHKALRARKDSTSALFVFLLEDLELTVREELASCIEVSHKSIRVQKAAELLNLSSAQAVMDFANARDDWHISGDQITFPSRNQVKILSKESIPASWTVRECLNMAVELDKIV